MKTNVLVNMFFDFVANIANEIKQKQIGRFVSSVEFSPFIQPIFSNDGDKVIGCEVLLRVKTDEGYKSPVNYINELENSEHINDITSQLLHDVATFFLRHKCKLPDGFYFSFNIYAPQLSSPGFVHEIMSFNEKFMDKASLVLEIVERGTLKLDEDTIEIMEELMSKGIRFAIDDFGAGTSSLKYIEHVGFSTIKIDRELTLSTGDTLIYKKVIDAIVSLSSQLGLSVTAEGVENPLQLKLLHDAGVNSMQGYYLAKPMEMPSFVNNYL